MKKKHIPKLRGKITIEAIAMLGIYTTKNEFEPQRERVHLREMPQKQKKITAVCKALKFKNEIAQIRLCVPLVNGVKNRYFRVFNACIISNPSELRLDIPQSMRIFAGTIYQILRTRSIIP